MFKNSLMILMKKRSDGFSLGAVQLKPGVIELLDFLEEHRIPKVVASSNQRHIIELLLEKNQLTNYFETIVSAENVKRAKPDPEIFLLAHEYLGTKKQETLVLEDSKNGILAAASAEIPVIMIPEFVGSFRRLATKNVSSFIFSTRSTRISKKIK